MAVQYDTLRCHPCLMTKISEQLLEIIIEQYENGKSLKELSEKYMKSYSAIKKAKPRYFQRLDLPPAPKVRQSVLTPFEKRRAIQIVEEGHFQSLSTIKKKLDCRACKKTLRRYFISQGLHNHKQKVVMTLGDAHKLARVQFATEVMRMTPSMRNQIWFSNETMIRSHPHKMKLTYWSKQCRPELDRDLQRMERILVMFWGSLVLNHMALLLRFRVQ